MSFLVQFMLPFFALLTAGLFLITYWQMKTSQQHDEKEEKRHKSLKSSQDKIVKEVQKVGSKIDSEIIPRLNTIYSKKEPSIFELSTEGVIQALEKIGSESSFVSEDGDFFLVGLEDVEDLDSNESGFKVYYFIHLNIEAKDLMIECHAYELKSFGICEAQEILKLNNKFRVAGFSIQELSGRNILKAQYLIDAPNNQFSSDTLGFTLSCLLEATKEAVDILNQLETDIAFIEADELFDLQLEASLPNKQIQTNANMSVD